MIFLTTALLLLATAVLGACGSVASPATATQGSTVAVPTAMATTHAGTARCAQTAPATATGYTALWATTPVALWGGGDVSISVRLADGREVWLYGDTLSTGRFAHSTAIVQDRGCLHVSRGGAQLLPNSGSSWSWIVSAAVTGPTTVKILAESVHRTGLGVWDFATGTSRYATATVGAAGDVTFVRWLPGTVPTPPPAADLVEVGPHHFAYAREVHHEIRLADGRHLVTTCQTWDDGVVHPVDQYRPLFSEQ